MFWTECFGSCDLPAVARSGGGIRPLIALGTITAFERVWLACGAGPSRPATARERTVHMIETSIARAHHQGAGIACNNGRGNGGRDQRPAVVNDPLADDETLPEPAKPGPHKNQSQKSPVNFILITHGLPKIVRDAEGSRKSSYARLRSQSVAPGGILV
jgi:hypothetical protein